MRGSLRSPVELIFVSKSMAKSYVSRSSNNVHIHVSYDPYVFRSSIRDCVPQRDFVCVGRVSTGKGQHLLIEALAQLEISGKNPSLDFFGTGVEGDPYADRLQSQIKVAGGTPRICYHGFRRDVTSLLSGFRFLVAPSKYEPLGRVVIEAWEAGIVPIVYAGSGGAAEIVRASRGGLTFSAWTSEALAETLSAALALSTHDYNEMAVNGRRWANETLSLERYRAALNGVLYPPLQ
jgi:glycosyltransferase involved in cell wall biosynthesis